MKILQFNPKVEIPVMGDITLAKGKDIMQADLRNFIRLAGCNVGCSWCDAESWEVNRAITRN